MLLYSLKATTRFHGEIRKIFCRCPLLSGAMVIYSTVFASMHSDQIIEVAFHSQSLYLTEFVKQIAWILIACLALSTLGKIFSRQHTKIFFLFSQKSGFNISCKLSPLETVCLKYQILFSVKNKKNVTNLSSAELAQRVIKARAQLFKASFA